MGVGVVGVVRAGVGVDPLGVSVDGSGCVAVGGDVVAELGADEGVRPKPGAHAGRSNASATATIVRGASLVMGRA